MAPLYEEFLSPELKRHLLGHASPVQGVPGLAQLGPSGGLETPEALSFLAELYRKVLPHLTRVLEQRAIDRKFIDERVRATCQFNIDHGRTLRDPDFSTVLGLEDSKGRLVFGPYGAHYSRPGGKPVAPLPEFLKGPHVTLFGPPDSAKMAINAMNAYHRKLPGEPAVVGELLAQSATSPMWGADDEDSKTPLRADLIDAAVNLKGCFSGEISLQEGGKRYDLAQDHLALPIKRFPGLALPSTFLFCDGEPVPLHLYDFALHLFHCWDDPRALVFYVPKLENEEEARYIHSMIAAAEDLVSAAHPAYKQGSVRLMIVLENPRAILRAHEIMDALHPYFAGASLGWHDYLASMARLFKEDSHYRIPVKADPDIVIKHIQASHRLLADVVGSRGGIKVGGMYGILPIAGNAKSLQITLRGFFKDVLTQLKRDLTGFWVAHPDFVRLGLAIVEAWKLSRNGDGATKLDLLIEGMLEEPYRSEIRAFARAQDIAGLDINDPGYVRSLIVANIEESDTIANHDPEEIRYNVFQSLQYLTDWLSGNGCVALPTVIEGTPVRVMDDLATAERSRWEVWHEVRHGRFAAQDLVRIAHEELTFIRRDLSDGKKIVQVKWDERTACWYPIALELMLQMMTDPEPVEFATELLMPFTIPEIREAQDPWSKARELDPGKFTLPRQVQRFHHYFEACGSQRFAQEMAKRPVEDLSLAEKLVLSFSKLEVIEAAGFHGDIGQSKKTLDARAAGEQSGVDPAATGVLQELARLGTEYRERFGFKFLISAQGRSAPEMLDALKERLGGTPETELANARRALWEITRKRLNARSGAQYSSRTQSRPDLNTSLIERLAQIRERHGVRAVSMAVSAEGFKQSIDLGESRPGLYFQLASLSKPIASAFAIEYFAARGIPLSTPVQELLERAGSKLKLASQHPDWPARVTIRDLLSHSALNQHYVVGTQATQPGAESAQTSALLPKVEVIHEPGTVFKYSGGGFLVLEHLICQLEGGAPVPQVTQAFLDRLGLGVSFVPSVSRPHHARGYMDDGSPVPGDYLCFPSFAAGASGTALDVARFLNVLTQAYRTEGTAISHDTAVEMLNGSDRGCMDFMGCRMGLGIFVAEAGANRLAIHQGANEGFRAIFVHCFDGPDRGKGVVVLANGDNSAVPMIAELVSEVLLALEIRGIDHSKLLKGFSAQGLAQEQIVNLGYKSLIFDAFEPDLPEPIASPGPIDPLSRFNLAVGGTLLRVSNQKFARAENLLSPRLPVFDPELFERQGKVMDSWESARHNPAGVDALEFRLKSPSRIAYLRLSTLFHDGNQAEHVRVSARAVGSQEWKELLPKTRMLGHALLSVALPEDSTEYSSIQVEMYPDGGLSRLGLYAELPESERAEFKPIAEARPKRSEIPIPKTSKPLVLPYAANLEEVARNISRARERGLSVNWASRAYGGRVLRASNQHYGPADQVVSPFMPLHMFDGLESSRSREPGHHEEVEIQLGSRIRLERVRLDFTHFVNNNPLEISISARAKADAEWTEIVPRHRVKAFAGNFKEYRLSQETEASELSIKTFPDGGINRIAVYSW